MAKGVAAYVSIVEKIFFDHYKEGASEFEFERDEIAEAATYLGVTFPKNLGDVVYTFRYRKKLPGRILATQPEGKHWLILGAGAARYHRRPAPTDGCPMAEPRKETSKRSRIVLLSLILSGVGLIYLIQAAQLFAAQ